MFIAPSYTNYQLKSVEFSDIAFELWKVSKFSNNTVLYDKVNDEDVIASISQVTNTGDSKQSINKQIKKFTEEDYFEDKTNDSIEFYNNLKECILSEFDDLEIIFTKLYIGFKINKKTILSVVLLKKDLNVYINAKIK